MKLSANGDFIWGKRMATLSKYASINKLLIEQNSIVLVGSCDQIATSSDDISVAKFDFNGNLLWFKTYGHPQSTSIRPSTATILKDGSYVIGIRISSDIYLLKLSTDGVVEASFGNDATLSDYLKDIYEDKDGNIITIGSVYPNNVD